MTNRHDRPLTVIGAPTSAGAYGPGQERAPGTFRKHGLIERLRQGGRPTVVDAGDGTVRHWRTDPDHPEAANVSDVAAAVREVAGSVAAAFDDGHDVLVLGGDCTVELGTVLGALADDTSAVALAYVDFDADLNTPVTGDGILDWMGVAHLLGLPDTEPELSGLRGDRPMLTPEAVRLIGTSNITEGEQAAIDRHGVRLESLDTVIDDRAGVVDRTREWAAGYDRLLVHVDLDVLDFARFQIAEHGPRPGGLTVDQLTALLVDLCALPNWRALTTAEINPDRPRDEAAAFAALIEMLAAAVG